VEIVGLADTTVLVLVPQAGDDVQAIKSGVMEIADVFVVNKADRDGVNSFLKNIVQLVHSKPAGNWEIPVIKAVATKGEGVDELITAIDEHNKIAVNTRKAYLLAEKAYRIIQNKKMQDISKKILKERIDIALQKKDFNLYAFVKTFI
jgi:LAO/AO transport system kinase